MVEVFDTPGVVIIPIKLTGLENYGLWSQLMKLALRVAAELMPSILYCTSAKQVWLDFKERFDRSNLTRVYHLWTEIMNLRQVTVERISHCP